MLMVQVDMRLFITSYQKTGTHQIMPMFIIQGLQELPMIVDRSFYNMSGLPNKYGSTQFYENGVDETITELKKFPLQAFGHLPYRPEYHAALNSSPTKIIFNIRDPRDVVLAEYGNMMRHYAQLKPGLPWLDLFDSEDGKQISKKDDPISALIELAAYRWPKWMGWLDKENVFTIQYESLRLFPVETIKLIQTWMLPFICPDFEYMRRKVLPQKKNPTFRKGNVGDWRKDFTEEHKLLAKKLLGDIIERLGYEV